MNNQEQQELNKKLVKWAGFPSCYKGVAVEETGIGYWVQSPGSEKTIPLPDFTESLDACFEWLTPDNCSVCFNHLRGKVVCLLTVPKGAGLYGSFVISSGKVGKGKAALALCLAIEKLIDGES